LRTSERGMSMASSPRFLFHAATFARQATT
jgi:hypothetical protein